MSVVIQCRLKSFTSRMIANQNGGKTWLIARKYSLDKKRFCCVFKFNKKVVLHVKSFYSLLLFLPTQRIFSTQPSHRYVNDEMES